MWASGETERPFMPPNMKGARGWDLNMSPANTCTQRIPPRPRAHTHIHGRDGTKERRRTCTQRTRTAQRAAHTHAHPQLPTRANSRPGWEDRKRATSQHGAVAEYPRCTATSKHGAGAEHPCPTTSGRACPCPTTSGRACCRCRRRSWVRGRQARLWRSAGLVPIPGLGSARDFAWCLAVSSSSASTAAAIRPRHPPMHTR